jgi:hypothetical protein
VLSAHPEQAFGEPRRATVLTTTIDQQTNLLTIRGENFGSATPTVRLAGNQLVVDSYSPSTQTVVAILPSTLAAGSYSLEVTGDHSTASFVVTSLP